KEHVDVDCVVPYAMASEANCKVVCKTCLLEFWGRTYVSVPIRPRQQVRAHTQVRPYRRLRTSLNVYVCLLRTGSTEKMGVFAGTSAVSVAGSSARCMLM